MKVVKLKDGTVWPLDLNTEDTRHERLGWKCRYDRENISKTDLLLLAEVCDAYMYLIYSTNKRRNEVCNELKQISEELDLYDK